MRIATALSLRLTTAVFLLAAIPAIPASAQWYLFPGKNKKKNDKETPVPARPAPDTFMKTLPLVPAGDTSAAVKEQETDDFVLDIPQVLHITMLLPLRSTIKPSSNFYEFYSGALLAASDLGKDGMDICLDIYDTDDIGKVVPESAINRSDIIIGPVRPEDIRQFLPRCSGSQYIISPLEPKVISIADSSNVIQLPVSWERQTDELVRWMYEEKVLTDALFVLTDDAPAPLGKQARYLVERIEESGMEYAVIRSSSVEDLQLAGRNAFVVASDDEQFICTAVNNIGKLAIEREGIVLYGQSRLKSMDGIHSESLFRANARLVSNYHVDYNDAKVKDFILRFRAVFSAEPSSFAFHGYDTMHYFATVAGIYGRQWKKRISRHPASGLQTDFRFEEDVKAGKENIAVRRIRYFRDLSTSLQ